MHLGIFGLSGVGKTTLAKFIAERNVGVSATSASKLIREFGGWVEYECLNTDSVKSNQEVLVRAYNWYKNKHPNTLIELHNIIETENGLEFVDPSIILALDLDIVFFLHAPAEDIAARRLSDDSKKRRLAAVSDLRELQDIALSNLQTIFSGHVSIVEESNAVERIECYLKSVIN